MSRLDLLPQPAPRFVDTSIDAAWFFRADAQQGGNNGNPARRRASMRCSRVFRAICPEHGKTHPLADLPSAGDVTDGARVEDGPGRQRFAAGAAFERADGQRLRRERQVSRRPAPASIPCSKALLPRILEQASNGERVGDRQSGSSAGAARSASAAPQGSEEIDPGEPGIGSEASDLCPETGNPFQAHRGRVRSRALKNPEAVDPSEPGPVAE